MQSIVDFSDVNDELGLTSTTQMSASNTGFRNIANDNSGEINMTQVRRGINFPGGWSNDAGRSPSLYYRLTNGENATANLVMEVEDVDFGAGQAANCTIKILASGTIQYIGVGENGTYTFSRTWLTDGAAGDYTANVSLFFGAINGAGSSATATDLVLSTDRTWTVRATSSVIGVSNNRVAIGNLIIKESGTEIFRRPFKLTAFAERL